METPFPKAERVKFEKNPLHEVIFQAKFDGVLGKGELNSQKASLLHEKVRGAFPFFERLEKESVVDENEDAEVFVEYRFLNDKRNFMISLSDSSLSLATLDYGLWEDFFCEIDCCLDAIKEVLGVAAFSRIGLRYRDVINRSELGISEEEKWSGLIRKDLLPVCLDEKISLSLSSYKTRFSFPLNNKGEIISVEVLNVIRKKEGGECLLIDADFYFEDEVVDGNSARDLLSRFNGFARDFFHWAISGKLYRAMHPQKI